MNKSSIIKLLILIISLGLNVQIIRSIHAEQATINTDRASISKMPLASFHKFWADVKWMLYIQHMGSIDLTTEKNSKDLFDEAKGILGLDPGFYKVYEISALMLSAKTPGYAIELLEKGQKTQKNKDDWRLWSMAGNIRHQETFFNKKVDRMEKLRSAVYYYGEALKRPGVMPVLEKTYIKTRAQLSHEVSKKKVKEATPEQIQKGEVKEINLLVAELEEWHKYLNDKTNSPEFGMEGESMMLSVDEDTKSDILSLIQRIRNNPKTRDNKLGKEISQKLLTSMFQNLHVCTRCYTTYQAGDKFCGNCANSVKIFGVCHNPECRKVHRGGKFCQYCGTSTKAPKTRKKK